MTEQLNFLLNCFFVVDTNGYKKHSENVGPIRHCEPPHAACSNFTLPFTRCRYCRTPPAHRCPQQQQQRRQQRQRVTEGTAMNIFIHQHMLIATNENKQHNNLN